MKPNIERSPRPFLYNDISAAVSTLAAALGGNLATRADHLLRGKMPGTISVSRGGKRRITQHVIQQRVARARAKVDPMGLYLIRRDGGLFRHDARGYTIDIAHAGIFVGSETWEYLDVEGLDLIPLTSVRDRIIAEMGDTLEKAATRVSQLHSLLARMEVRADV